MKAAIIGMGFIGKAQAQMFRKRGDELVTWDVTDTAPYPRGQIAECDFAVICVGTPPGEGGRAYLGHVYEAFSTLPPAVPVLLRSTVPPGTTDDLQGRDLGRLVAHAPEFMHERDGGAWRECTDVPYLILGGSPAARGFFQPHLEKVFPHPAHQCTALEAELIKYTVNLYWAAKVTFVNEMAGIAAAFGADWEAVREGWLMDPRVSQHYTAMAGFPPGFGGRCWPKDLSALIQASRDAGYLPLHLEAIRKANAWFRRQSP